MHRVFISYHHKNDQAYKDWLVNMGAQHQIFHDWSVGIGDIDDRLSNQDIRCKIRDDFLRSSTVTIVLVGTETRYRMHCDWEIYSSMINGKRNKKSGILVITLPDTGITTYHAAHENEKVRIHPECQSWRHVDSRSEYEALYPYMPARIIDNLMEPKAKVSVVPWQKIAYDPGALGMLISNANASRDANEYDLSRPMRRRNHTDGGTLLTNALAGL